MLVIALIGREIISLATSYFFKKVTRDDYITKKDCEACQVKVSAFVSKKDCEACAKSDDSVINRLTTEMAAVKGILLVMAVNQKIPAEELKGLTN